MTIDFDASHYSWSGWFKYDLLPRFYTERTIIESIKERVLLGVDEPNDEALTPLMEAVWNGHLDLVTELIDRPM